MNRVTHLRFLNTGPTYTFPKQCFRMLRHKNLSFKTQKEKLKKKKKSQREPKIPACVVCHDTKFQLYAHGSTNPKTVKATPLSASLDESYSLPPHLFCWRTSSLGRTRSDRSHKGRLRQRIKILSRGLDHSPTSHNSKAF